DRTIGGFADDLDVALRVEQCAEAGPDQCLVVDEQDPYHVASPSRSLAPASPARAPARCGAAASLVGGAAIGIRAVTRKPPPGRGPADRSPPSADTRSCMPRMPKPGPPRSPARCSAVPRS